MNTNVSRALPIRAKVLMPGVLLGIGLLSGTVAESGQIDPDADKIVRAMSSYMDALSTFSVNLDVDDEILDTTGRKLQLSASTSLDVQHPDRLYSNRRGPVADVELIVDGKLMTIHGKGLNVYAQWETSGNIDGAIDQVRVKTGLDVSAGDLLYSNSYAGLMDGVVSGNYVGTGFVNGIECHHLAFRQEKVDWQLWVQAGDTPLPMKYVITSKWVTGAPQYSVRFQDWNTKPEISANRFKFVKPEGAKQIKEISFDAKGELMLERGQ